MCEWEESYFEPKITTHSHTVCATHKQCAPHTQLLPFWWFQPFTILTINVIILSCAIVIIIILIIHIIIIFPYKSILVWMKCLLEPSSGRTGHVCLQKVNSGSCKENFVVEEFVLPSNHPLILPSETRHCSYLFSYTFFKKFWQRTFFWQLL